MQAWLLLCSEVLTACCVRDESQESAGQALYVSPGQRTRCELRVGANGLPPGCLRYTRHAFDVPLKHIMTQAIPDIGSTRDIIFKVDLKHMLTHAVQKDPKEYTIVKEILLETTCTLKSDGDAPASGHATTFDN